MTEVLTTMNVLQRVGRKQFGLFVSIQDLWDIQYDEVVPGSRQAEGVVTVKPWNSLPHDAVRAKNLQGKKQLNISQDEKSIGSYEMQTPQLCLRRSLSYKQLAVGGKYKGFVPMCLPHSHPLPCVRAVSPSWRWDTGTDWPLGCPTAGILKFRITLIYITFIQI